MKMRLITSPTLILILAFSALADEPKRRTIVIRDGQVVQSDGWGDFDSELLRGGKRAFLGVSLVNLTPELREHYGAAKDSGALVGSLENGSPADKAGLRVGDIVLAVDGKDIESTWDLRRVLSEKKDGDTARIEVLRGKARQTFVATLVEREQPMLRVTNFEDLGRLGERFSGPEWRARVESTQTNCAELQTKLRTLEGRMKDLEKKLQK